MGCSCGPCIGGSPGAAGTGRKTVLRIDCHERSPGCEARATFIGVTDRQAGAPLDVERHARRRSTLTPHCQLPRDAPNLKSAARIELGIAAALDQDTTKVGHAILLAAVAQTGWHDHYVRHVRLRLFLTAS